MQIQPMKPPRETEHRGWFGLHVKERLFEILLLFHAFCSVKTRVCFSLAASVFPLLISRCPFCYSKLHLPSRSLCLSHSLPLCSRCDLLCLYRTILALSFPNPTSSYKHWRRYLINPSGATSLWNCLAKTVLLPPPSTWHPCLWWHSWYSLLGVTHMGIVDVHVAGSPCQLSAPCKFALCVWNDRLLEHVCPQ